MTKFPVCNAVKNKSAAFSLLWICSRKNGSKFEGSKKQAVVKIKCADNVRLPCVVAIDPAAEITV